MTEVYAFKVCYAGSLMGVILGNVAQRLMGGFKSFQSPATFSRIGIIENGGAMLV